MREQAQDEPQWFTFRTDVSLRGDARPRTSVAWLVLIAAACSACAAFAWLIGSYADPLDRLSRMLGFVPA